MAVKDLIGGWKENAHMYKSTKACSALKRIFGNAWKPIMEGVGINNATCPIPAVWSSDIINIKITVSLILFEYGLLTEQRMSANCLYSLSGAAHAQPRLNSFTQNNFILCFRIILE